MQPKKQFHYLPAILLFSGDSLVENMMFQEIPANKRSIWMRRPLLGVGINDADYLVILTDAQTGKQERCPFYECWHHMLTRCYSAGYQDKRPTYKGCTVCDEWLTFSNFRAWMETQGWQGKHLDKDIITVGNKSYSPENCCFVSHRINSLLLDCGAARGKYPLGTSFHKRLGKYQARIGKMGKLQHIGSYDTAEAAETAYKAEKFKYIRSVAMTQTNPIRDGLLRHAAEYA